MAFSVSEVAFVERTETMLSFVLDTIPRKALLRAESVEHLSISYN